MASIGDVLLRVLLDDKGVEAQARATGQKAGRAAGANLARGIGALGGALAGATTTILAPVATNVDNALDTIRAGTGLTGDALAGVQEDFRVVAGQVPDDLGTVAAVVADLQTRTGRTGESLQTLSEQILDFSRATGSDAASNVALATRVFGDWNIATEDQAGALDSMLRASQATGVGVDRLQANVVQFGAPMRQLGFSFDESITLLGKFEKEGVNLETVMSGMRQGLARMARAGEDPAETLQRLQEEIKGAGSQAEANSLAVEAFGARAGPDMAAAIREGRFELGDLFETVTEGGETVQSVTADTEDMADGFKGWLNTASLALGEFAAPLAGFSEIAGPMLYALPLLTSGVGALAGGLVHTVIPAVLSFGKVLMGLVGATGPIGIIILAVGALFLAWETNFLGIRDIVDTIFGWIADVALPWITGTFDAIAAGVSAAVGVITGVIEGILGVVSTVASAIGGFFDFVTGGANNAKAQVNSVRPFRETEAGANAAAAAAERSARIVADRSRTAVTGGAALQTQASALAAARGSYHTGAWEIPSNQLAMLHRGEMVVPPGPAEALRSWFGGDFMAAAAVPVPAGGDTFNVRVDGLVQARTTSEIGAGLKRLSQAGQLVRRRRFVNER